MSNWYFHKDGEEVGPVSAKQLVELAGKGGLQLDTPVRRADMEHCIDVEKVKELKAAIEAYQGPASSTSPDRGFSEQPEHETTAPVSLTITESIAHRVTDLAGVDRLEGFSLVELFSEVFKKHKAEEVEEYFAVGTASTTPDITEVDTTWPRPWVFFRTLVAAYLVYFGFLQMWRVFEEKNVLPGLMITGAFVVPAATLIFFIEMNARRNVSLYQVLRMVFAGGVISLALSLILFRIQHYVNIEWLGASLAGPVEETGKLAALLLVAFSCRYKYILNGLLFGAAVGTGFAAFESAGYAYRMGTLGNDVIMTHVAETRGLLSPFMHIAWTAMCGAALWSVKGDRWFNPFMLFNHRFLRVFVIAIGLHMSWNLPIHHILPYRMSQLMLGALAWVIIFAFIQAGLKQLREEKTAALEGGTKEA